MRPLIRLAAGGAPATAFNIAIPAPQAAQTRTRGGWRINAPREEEHSLRAPNALNAVGARPLHLGRGGDASLLYLVCISSVSRLYLVCISSASRSVRVSQGESGLVRASQG